MPAKESEMAKPLILIAENELALGELLTFGLESANFTPEWCGDGRLALLRLDKPPIPDLLVLDWMMPGPSGIDVCKRVRGVAALSQMPILMLTARSDEADIIKGLDAGVDDYLTKPFSMKELTARIRALLRRANHTQTRLAFGELVIEIDNYRVLWSGTHLPLSPTGFKILTTLAARPGKIMPREKLLAEVWGENADIDLRTIDANIKRIRTLLKQATGKDFIQTSHGFGYFWQDKP